MTRQTLHLGKLLYKAQDEEAPTEEELVQEFRDSPVAHWKEYLQLLVRQLQTSYGTKVVLVSPEVDCSP